MPTSKQRRAAEERHLRRQAERRQQQAERRRRTNVILSVVGTVFIIGVVITLIAVTSGSDSSPKAGASTTPNAKTTAPTTSAPKTTAAASSATSASAAPAAKTSAAAKPAPAATTTCSYPASGTAAARKVTVPPATAAARGTVQVTLATSQGAMTFTLDRTEAPCTVNSFVSLARQKYYDNTSCHRLVTKSIFVLQCGDPTGLGSGGPGYKFADELTGREKYVRGVLAMANAGPNVNGSQFFIVDRNTQLGDAYTIFGRVTAGLRVVDKVYQAGTSDGSTDGPPKLRLTFRSVTVG